jgi:hypothetical protein
MNRQRNHGLQQTTGITRVPAQYCDSGSAAVRVETPLAAAGLPPSRDTAIEFRPANNLESASA